uniref:Uncharacterized protein n=1 Tax=Mycena chlorophos TaxID=658473 RepID=A0ABQ0LSW0_MYCCL|nr:predicted protein [Mycena chlorophos]
MAHVPRITRSVSLRAKSANNSATTKIPAPKAEPATLVRQPTLPRPASTSNLPRTQTRRIPASGASKNAHATTRATSSSSQKNRTSQPSIPSATTQPAPTLPHIAAHPHDLAKPVLHAPAPSASPLDPEPTLTRCVVPPPMSPSGTNTLRELSDEATKLDIKFAKLRAKQEELKDAARAVLAKTKAKLQQLKDRKARERQFNDNFAALLAHHQSEVAKTEQRLRAELTKEEYEAFMGPEQEGETHLTTANHGGSSKGEGDITIPEFTLPDWRKGSVGNDEEASVRGDKKAYLRGGGYADAMPTGQDVGGGW